MIVAALACFALLVIAWLAAPTGPELTAEAPGDVQLSESPA